jgi:hypothetical protein
MRLFTSQIDGDVVDPSEVRGLVAEVLTMPMRWSERDECFRPVPNVLPTLREEVKLQGRV